MVLYACVLLKLNCQLGGAAGGLWLKRDVGPLECGHDRLDVAMASWTEAKAGGLVK